MARLMIRALCTSFLLMAPSLFGATAQSCFPKAALERLLEGNERYRTGRPMHCAFECSIPHNSWEETSPYVLILACSDACDSVARIFDQRCEDLLVIRFPGNILNPDVKFSIDYALDHNPIALIFVLGHQGCCAIEEVLSLRESGKWEYADCFPQIEEALYQGSGDLDDRLAATIKQNVKLTMEKLALDPNIALGLRRNTFSIAGGYYHTDTGEVEIVENFSCKKG